MLIVPPKRLVRRTWQWFRASWRLFGRRGAVRLRLVISRTNYRNAGATEALASAAQNEERTQVELTRIHYCAPHEVTREFR